jgi:YVTN family beta-propeller protein
VYVASFAAQALVAVDPATLSVLGQAAIGAGAAGLALSPAGDLAYVANMNDNTVSIVRTADMSVLATVPVGSQPVGVATAPDGSAVFVANSADGTLSTIDAATRSVVATVYVGEGPFSPGAFVADAAPDPRAALVGLAQTLASLACLRACRRRGRSSFARRSPPMTRAPLRAPASACHASTRRSAGAGHAPDQRGERHAAARRGREHRDRAGLRALSRDQRQGKLPCRYTATTSAAGAIDSRGCCPIIR